MVVLCCHGILLKLIVRLRLPVKGLGVERGVHARGLKGIVKTLYSFLVLQILEQLNPAVVRCPLESITGSSRGHFHAFKHL